MPSSKILRWSSVIIILLVFLLIRSYRSSSLGTQSDEGVHITAAERIASGDVLYRDLFENRTPLVEWLLASLFKIVSPNVFIGRILAQLTAVLTAALLITVMNNVYKEWEVSLSKNYNIKWFGSLIAALFFAFTPLAIFWARFTMLEHWQVFFSLLSITAISFALTSENEIWWFVAGLAAGGALLSKQSALTLIFATLIFYLLLLKKEKNTAVIRSMVVWLAGLMIILATFIIILASSDSLGNFYEFIFTTDRFYPFVNLLDKIENWINWSFRQPYLPLAALGVLAILSTGITWITLLFLWAMVEVAALFIPAQLDVGWGGFSHYTINAIVSLTLLAGIGMYWLWNRHDKLYARIIMIVVVLGVILTIPAWFTDLSFVIQESNYPEQDTEPEINIGNAIAAINTDDRPILVLANAIFYQLSTGEPSNLFFHYPEYLPQSKLKSWSDSDIVEALDGDQVGTVVISRMHLEERITGPIRNALWSNWEPIELYPYPYQRDIFLFSRQSNIRSGQQQPLAKFENNIELLDVESEKLSNGDLLVRLVWSATQEIEQNLTVFIHLEDADGKLVNQDDDIPAVGFRPTTSWHVGEKIVDWHTIKMNKNASISDKHLRVGLYNSDTNERIARLSAGGKSDLGYIWELKD